MRVVSSIRVNAGTRLIVWDRTVTQRMAVPLVNICVFIATISLIFGFNIDVDIPVIKKGPDGSYFGYSVAEHIMTEQPDPNSDQFV